MKRRPRRDWIAWLFNAVSQLRPAWTFDQIAGLTLPQAEAILRQEDERSTGDGTLKLKSIGEALEYQQKRHGAR